MKKSIKNPFKRFSQKGAVLTLCVTSMLFGFSCRQITEKEDLDEKTDFFYVKEESGIEYYKQEFTIRKDHVILKCKSADDAKAMTKQSIFSFALDIGFWVLGGIDPKKTKLDELLQKPEVADIAYGMEYNGNGIINFPTNRFFVLCKEGQTPESVLDATDLTDSVETIELFDAWSNLYLVTLNVKLGDALRISRVLFESGLRDAAEPVFFGIGNLLD